MSESVAAPAAESSAPAESSQEQSSPVSQESQLDSSGNPIEAAAEQLQEAVENGEISQKEANKLIRKFQLKVDGKVIDREIDLGDEDYLRQQLQLAEAAKSRMSETASIKKAFQSEMARLKQDPWAVMKDLGLDPDEMAQLRLEQRIEEMKKSPEQVAQEKIQKELQEAREEARRLKEEKEQMEMSKFRQQAAEELETEIMGALDGHRTLPKSQYVVKRIADSMLWAMNNGFENVTADDVVPLVEREMKEEFNKFYDELPEELMERFIGQKNVDRMRKRRVAAARPQSVPSVNDIKQTSKGMSADNKPQAPKAKIPAKDFFKKIGK
jgi:hypothetical protein